MELTDQQLLTDWCTRKDAHAFQAIVQRHATMVFHTALRILKNPADAEDTTQQCFETLITTDKTNRIESLGAWLHGMATKISLKHIRSVSRRSQREKAYAEINDLQNDTREWQEIYPIIDEAIQTLQEKYRAPVIAHFLEGQTHAAIAEDLNVSRTTVTNDINQGIQQIEATLKRKGVPTTLALAPTMATQLANAAPMNASLISNLGKLSLTQGQTASTAAMSNSATSALGWFFKHKAVLIGTLTVVSIFSYRVLQPTELAQDAQFSAAPTIISADSVSSQSLPPSPQPSDPETLLVAQQSTQSVQDDPERVATTDEEVDLTDPHAIWRKVVKVNQLWLNPSPKYLRYTLKMDDYAYNVSLAGDQGRFESLRPDYQRTLLFSGTEAVGLTPRRDLERSPFEMSPDQLRTLRQGTLWSMAVHILARKGLPDNARIINTFETSEGKHITIEADVEKTGGSVGLGLLNTWFGNTGYRTDRVRITIATPDFVPILEESIRIADDGEHLTKIGIGPVFFEIGDQRAPRELQYHHADLIMDTKTWALSATFRLENESWLLHYGENIQDGSVVKRIRTENVSTDAFDIASLHMPTEEELVALLAEWEAGSELPYDDGIDRPRVVSVWPPHGSTEVIADSTFRVAFDRPMNPTTVNLQFEKGGYYDVAKIDYNPDTYEFTIPLRLAPGERHRIFINERRKLSKGRRNTGFASSEGIGANRYVWEISTGTDSPDPDAEPPQIVALSPESGDTITALTQFTVQFDQPMNPHAYAIKAKEKEPRDRDHYATILGLVEYDEESHTFTIPMLMTPESEHELSLSGFKSAKGIDAPPHPLHFTTNSDTFATTHKQKLEENGNDPQLFGLLQQIQSAREQLTSLSEVVHTIREGSIQENGLARNLRTDAAIFKFDHNAGFFGDISEIMQSRFIVASDTENSWHYYRSQKTETLRMDPFGDLGHKNVSIADPFGLLERDISEAIDQLNLEYKGLVSNEQGSWHLIQSTTAEALSKDHLLARIVQWWIDPSTLLPVYLKEYNRGMRTQRIFEYKSINQPIPAEEFQLIGLDHLAPESTPLKLGFDTRYLNLRDGADGRMTLRWGITGPKGSESGGLN
ncbi:MAG: sigma-70 family RNA polymerase sigma factor [Candidatus Hydrogenedentota bacterium]